MIDSTKSTTSLRGTKGEVSPSTAMVQSALQSMARSEDYDSASSHFFAVHEGSTYLDGNYVVFRYVMDGTDVVDTIWTARHLKY